MVTLTHGGNKGAASRAFLSSLTKLAFLEQSMAREEVWNDESDSSAAMCLMPAGSI
jgi:hypothetical protein